MKENKCPPSEPIQHWVLIIIKTHIHTLARSFPFHPCVRRSTAVPRSGRPPQAPARGYWVHVCCCVAAVLLLCCCVPCLLSASQVHGTKCMGLASRVAVQVVALHCVTQRKLCVQVLGGRVCAGTGWAREGRILVYVRRVRRV